MEGFHTTKIFWVLFLCFIDQQIVNSMIDISLAKIGYNYALPLKLNSTYYAHMILDTGSSSLVTYNNPYNVANSSISSSICLELLNDGTTIEFFSSDLSGSCKTTRDNIELFNPNNNSVLNTTATHISATNIEIENPKLHQWGNANGDIGAAFCIATSFDSTGAQTISQCSINTPFQTIVSSATNETKYQYTFALDFRNPNSSITSLSSYPSRAQLGGYDNERYDGAISWLPQPYPSYSQYHEFFLYGLELCGVSMLGKLADNWRVLVDTGRSIHPEYDLTPPFSQHAFHLISIGSSCLTLPGEIYDNVYGWYNGNVELNSLSELPAFSFQVNTATGSDGSIILFLPLETLVVEASAISSKESSALYLNVAGDQSKRICLLKGDYVKSTSGLYSNPAPAILFGALALQSLYVVFDFNSSSIGLANKLTPAEMQYYNSSRFASCRSATICSGYQTYDKFANLCSEPNCNNYMFGKLDSTTHTCVYKTNTLIVGLIFVLLIVLCEVYSFFVAQYSAFSLIGQRRNHVNNRLYLPAKIDLLSVIIGRLLSHVTDRLFRAIFMRTEVNRDRDDAAQVEVNHPVVQAEVA